MSLLKYSASQCFPHYSIDYFDSDFTVLLRNYIAVGKELHGEETSWRIVRSLLIKKLLYSTSLAKINNSLSRPFDHYSLILSIYPGVRRAWYNQHRNRLASFVETCSKFTNSLLPIRTRRLKLVEAAKSHKLTLTRNNYAENTSSIETCKLEALILALACP